MCTVLFEETISNAVLDAALDGNLEQLIQCYQDGYPIPEEAIQNGCITGNVAIVKWCLDMNVPFTTDCIETAAYNGHLPILLLFLASGYQIDNADIVHNAALGGHIMILMWCRQQGYPITKHILHIAAQEGYLNIVKWGLTIGLEYTNNVANCAALYGHTGILRWLHANNYKIQQKKLVVYSIKAYKQNDTSASLRWCVKQGYISKEEYTRILSIKI